MAAVKQFFMLDGLLGGLSRYNQVHIRGETTGPLKHIMWGVFVLGTGLEYAHHHHMLPNPSPGRDFGHAAAAAPAPPQTLEQQVADLKDEISLLRKDLKDNKVQIVVK
uniref:Uncharacterized protein n=1 Tax=Pyramimonas obovata TaxID=1411642 RepID=A0A7S0RS68_9CHLO|mmetsp:Transcript_438/g.968  ORF Transcript_438/g.968 Transcript_438/m.968 type:complete len:108 (+) Transcript_438:112-435(+)